MRASTLFQQSNLFDSHLSVDSLRHIIDRKRGDGDGSKRLHLNTGLSGGLYRPNDFNSGKFWPNRHIDTDL